MDATIYCDPSRTSAHQFYVHQVKDPEYLATVIKFGAIRSYVSLIFFTALLVNNCPSYCAPREVLVMLPSR